jgi:ABC-type Zn2+ transport system substrate-binding protein/surface adhesin
MVAQLHRHLLIHTLTQSYTHTLIHSYTHTHIHSYTHSHNHTHIHSYTHSHNHTHIHSYTHSHNHTHIHSYTHTHTQKSNNKGDTIAGTADYGYGQIQPEKGRECAAGLPHFDTDLTALAPIRFT